MNPSTLFEAETIYRTGRIDEAMDLLEKLRRERATLSAQTIVRQRIRHMRMGLKVKRQRVSWWKRVLRRIMK